VSSGRRLALLVATDSYEDESFTALRAPAGDAEDLAAVLGAPEIGGFDVREPLTNRSERDVRKAIDRFLKEAERGDTVLLYISSHGVLSEDGRLYFATADTELDYLHSTAVSADWVGRAMDLSRARGKVLILDCCHSGAFARGMGTKSDGHVHVASHFQGRGNVTLTASDELEYALEEHDVKRLGAAQPRSLFTGLLVEGLKTGEADVNGDGLISVDELHKYVYDRMRDRTTSQTPGITGDMQGEIIIATTRPRPTPEQAPGLAEQLHSPYEIARAAAAEALRQLLADSDAGVRDAAKRALGDEPPESAPTRLRPQVVNLLRRADAKRSRGDLEGARANLDEALRLAPQAVEGLAARGDVRRRLGDFEGALEDFDAALALDADDYGCLVGRGRIRALNDESEASLADLERAIELDPDCADAYVARGFTFAFAAPRREADAAADFESALELEPAHAEALTGVGALAMESRPEEAKMAFDRALAADPELPLAFALRGALAGDSGADDLERACTLDPHSPSARTLRGFARLRSGQASLALEDFDAVVELLPRSPRALALRGSARVQADEPEAALADLEAALAIDGRNATALLWRGAAKLKLGDQEAALADLDAVTGRDDEVVGPPVAQFRAEALAGLGRHEEALADLDRAPAAALDAGMLVQRGQSRLELGRPGDAIADAQRALELDATHEGANELLPRAFLALADTLPRPASPAQQRARLAANRKLVEDAKLESDWYPDQKKAILDSLGDTEQLLWLCRCRRQGEMFRSVAFLLTTEQASWCKQSAVGGAQPNRILVSTMRKIERIEGGFKIRAAGKVEAAFTGFTGGGIDLLGPGVSLGRDHLLTLLRLLTERARAEASAG
jgi:tetratricopeptide (TPR) repeat protein